MIIITCGNVLNVGIKTVFLLMISMNRNQTSEIRIWMIKTKNGGMFVKCANCGNEDPNTL